MSAQTNHTLFLSGTHCTACKVLIETVVTEEPDITEAKVSLADETLTVRTNTDTDAATLATRLGGLLAEHGYGVSVERPRRAVSLHEWGYAVAAASLVLAFFAGLERSGLASLTATGNAGATTAFLVGLIASVSTCLAVVGGLVLSVSAAYAREGKGLRPQILFHVGRLAGFFVLGGLLGLVGERMHLGLYGSAVLGGIAAVIMLVLGIHLLDISPKVRVFTLPAGATRYVAALATTTGTVTPLMLGIATFFLPCGFTQSMQVLSLSSGSFLSGAMIMLSFALGTLPVLALLSFGSLDLAKGKYRGVFFKAAGIIVILFALFNLHNMLVMFGVIQPLLSL